jgi:hypothetical protein
MRRTGLGQCVFFGMERYNVGVSEYLMRLQSMMKAIAIIATGIVTVAALLLILAVFGIDIHVHWPF